MICTKCGLGTSRHNYGSRKKRMYRWGKGKNTNYHRGSSHASLNDSCSRCGGAVVRG